jgi:cell cycle checkpoint protein
MDGPTKPIFTAISSSARQLYLLLRCVSFSSKALVQITPEGLRFSVEETRAMQGLAFLDKALFTTYIFNPPPSISPTHSPSLSTDPSDPSTPTTQNPTFQISLSALLETLLIFGVNDSSSNAPPNPYGRSTWSSTSNNNATAFSTPALGLSTGVCRLSYSSPGAPLNITLTEHGVTTTCSLTTYEPDPHTSTAAEDTIPLARDALTLKIIMRASWLHDAIQELASTNPDRITFSASPTHAPFFALSATGAFGSATVEFPNKDPLLLETFTVNPRLVGDTGRVKNTYKYNAIKAAGKAMAIASKVSIRGDSQGVLSLQFMIEIGGEENRKEKDRDGAGTGANRGNVTGTANAIAGKVSFVDFRFVPFVEAEAEGEESDEDSEEEDGDDDEEEREHSADEE